MPTTRGCVKGENGAVEFTDYELTDPGPGQAIIRPTLTTICGSDIHMLDDYPEVPEGTPMGHECVGVVEAVGDGVERFSAGDPVAVSCLMTCGACDTCSRGDGQLCSVLGAPLNLVFGAQAELLMIGGADTTMAPLPGTIDPKAATLVTDILSTGFAAAERGGVEPGSTVAVFAQGPVGLCSTMGAKFYGAERIFAVESVPERIEMAKRFGATDIVDPANAVETIIEATGGVGVDVAIEALGKQITFENCCRTARPGGTISSVGVYGGIPALSLPTDGSFIHRKLVTTLCPVGTERLEYLLGLIESGKVDPTPLFTHDMALSDVSGAYDLFRSREGGVLKIALTPN